MFLLLQQGSVPVVPVDLTGAVTIKLALIASITGILSPMLMSWLQNRHRREEKAQEAAERAEVAKANLTAARTVAARAQEVADVLLEANRQQTKHQQAQTETIAEIHGLVNSSYTEAKEQELEARRSTLLLLREAAGHDPSPAQLEVLTQTTIKIERLEHELLQRRASLAPSRPVVGS